MRSTLGLRVRREPALAAALRQSPPRAQAARRRDPSERQAAERDTPTAAPDQAPYN